AAPSIVLDGDQFRIRLDVEKLAPVGEVVEADVGSRGSLPIQVELGSIDEAGVSVTLTGRLVGCPCQLRDLVLSPAVTSGLGGGTPVKGTVVLAGIDVHQNNSWTPLQGVTKASQWRKNASSGTDQLTSSSAGLQWPFAFSGASTATLSVADFPSPIPALVSSSVAAGSGGNAVQANGLDGQALQVIPIGSATTIPGSTTAAAVVSRSFAERASGGYLGALATQQVWTTASAASRVEAGLRKAGISISGVSSADTLTRLLDRQGPGLASVAFLANALAAAVLAAAAAIMGLVTAGRRRRYEYAALAATGASRRTLFVGLVVEQAGVLLFGAVTGIAAGLIAALVALRGVPEFVVTPQELSLSYVPDFGVLGGAVGAAIVLLLLVAVVASWVLVAGVRSDQLREAPA
ncbi:MAG: FtsX-like permease family protein, partial [Acidothermaceae bacterium]